MGSDRHGALSRRLCRGALVPVVALACVAGCGAREPALVNPGTSNVNRLGDTASTSQKDAGALADLGIDLQAIHPVGKAFVSRGHFAGRWTAEIAVNEAAKDVYVNLAPSSRFSVGSVLVKKHALTSTSAPGPTFAMTKREPGFYPEGGDWEYIVLDAEGRLEDRGKLAFCARCHAEGNTDSVFGLPEQAR
jgi:hypothetical protein